MDLNDRIRDILRRHPRAPGLSAAAVRNDDVIWKGGFGYADIEAKTTMTPSTILNVGSVTKTVTATAILQLVEEGRLVLDRDINTYLPFAIRNPTHPDIPIRVHDLLVHRSSILDDDRYGKS
ncbi:MAG: serine hydrolase domain-containing protein, partial [Pseudomonadota bacterium]